MNKKIIFFNLLVILNVAIFLKTTIVFVTCCLFLFAHQFFEILAEKKVQVENEELIRLKNEVSLIKTQIAMRK